MYTCIGGILCTRHTDYIHNYMTIRDMLRHVGWLGFWMNCALMPLKRKRCQTHFVVLALGFVPRFFVSTHVCAGSHKGSVHHVCWKILDCQKDVSCQLP